MKQNSEAQTLFTKGAMFTERNYNTPHWLQGCPTVAAINRRSGLIQPSVKDHAATSNHSRTLHSTWQMHYQNHFFRLNVQIHHLQSLIDHQLWFSKFDTRRAILRKQSCSQQGLEQSPHLKTGALRMCSKTGVSAPPCRSQDTMHKEGSITKQRHCGSFAQLSWCSIIPTLLEPAPYLLCCPAVAVHGLPFPFTIFLLLTGISL